MPQGSYLRLINMWMHRW